MLADSSVRLVQRRDRCRDYRRKNPNTWMEKGLDALATDMEKSTANTIRDLACAAWFVTSTASGVGLVINAAIILL